MDSTTPTTWLAIEPLAERLCCSQRAIYALKESGLLKAGEHFYAVGGRSLGGRHVYALEGVRQVLRDETAKAAKAKAIKIPETYDKEHMQQLIRKARR